jgi:Xaa-Pro aminopeptidase
MFAMHPTLLMGPADWDPARLPREEFAARMAAFWDACDPGVAGAIVYGSPRHHAELAYLTHFTPKLEPAIALIPRQGAPRLLVGGGVNMLGAAKPLTFVETLLPLREPGRAIARWRDELGSLGLVLVNGDAMPFGMRQEIERAFGGGLPDATPLVTQAMRRKSPRELALIRAACTSLDTAFSAMREAQRTGQGMTDIVLAGEQTAWRRGAQDVRSLFGRDGLLAPFTAPDDASADPLQVWLAVRHDGYWAEGFAVLARTEPSLAIAARTALDEAVPLVKPGAPYRALVARLAQAVGGHRHPVTHHGFGGTIGLALDVAGCLSATSDRCFAPGEVFSIRVGLREQNEGAIVSAMIAITESGHEVLWPGARQ